MSASLSFFVIAAMLWLALVWGFSRFKKLDSGSKVIYLLLCVHLIADLATLSMSKHNSIATSVHNIYNIIEFILLCLYFNEVIDVFYKRKVGWYIAGAGLAAGVANLVFLQPLHITNTNFLFLEGFTIIAISLLGFMRLLLKYEQLRVFRYHHFWFISIILLYWSMTYLNWGMQDLIRQVNLQGKGFVDVILGFAEFFAYLSISTVLIIYPKLQTSDS